jgi:Fe-S cluster assembly protein SufD
MTVTTPSAIADIRKRAAQFFESRGFPTTREEEWRFTNVAPIAKAHFPVAMPNSNGYSLRSAFESHPEVIEEHLGRYADYKDNAFVALN